MDSLIRPFRLNSSARLSLFLRISALLLLLLLGAQRSYASGGVVTGTTTLLNSGSPVDKIDIVFIGDGFTEGQQGKFNTKVDKAVQEFMAAHPLQALRSAFNIHRINIASPESGIDIYSTCGGEDTGKDNRLRSTALDTGYCSAGTGDIERCVLSSDTAYITTVVQNNAPGYDYIYVLVNDDGHGGCRQGDFAYSTIEDDFEEVVIHEMGHLVFGLGDEYDSDDIRTYTGGSRGEPNLSDNSSRSVKWNDLIADSTPVPTDTKSDCRDQDVDYGAPIDQVGTYEGASSRFTCGLFHAHPDSRMRRSDKPFGPASEQAIIRRLSSHLGAAGLAVTFNNLLIRKDHDNWTRGKGDIYMKYELRSNGEEIEGRWPSSGESKFDDNQSKSMNAYAGMIPMPATGTSAGIDVKVRDNDWPDSDDTIKSDATVTINPASNFEIDRSEYRLRGVVHEASIRVLLDYIHIIDDHDGFCGSGDIKVKYIVSNGSQEVKGRWPSSGTTDIGSGDSKYIGILAAAIPRPAAGNNLSITFKVIDEDGFLCGADDLVGQNTFTFSSADNFGGNDAVHVREQGDYRITFSIVPL